MGHVEEVYGLGVGVEWGLRYFFRENDGRSLKVGDFSFDMAYVDFVLPYDDLLNPKLILCPFNKILLHSTPAPALALLTLTPSEVSN